MHLVNAQTGRQRERQRERERGTERERVAELWHLLIVISKLGLLPNDSNFVAH